MNYEVTILFVAKTETNVSITVKKEQIKNLIIIFAKSYLVEESYLGSKNYN